MKRKNSYILIILILVIVATPLRTYAWSFWPTDIFPSTADLVNGVISYIGYGILEFFAFLLGLAGKILNYVLWYTILIMKYNLDQLTGINIAWKVMKDMMNIFFIFMLVYEGIKLILNLGSTQSIQRFITGIVLAAVLINFSLFFTKVMIDASNVITVGLYQSITGPMNYSNTANNDEGLGNTIANGLGLQSIYRTPDPGTRDTSGIFSNKSTGAIIETFVLAILLMLVATFVLLAISVVFVVRYIALVFLLMLSPVAYMGMGLSFMEPYARDWWNSFRSQVLFGPIFMLIMLIIMKLITSPGFLIVSDYSRLVNQQLDQASLDTLLKFVIIIGLLISSLIISKRVSSTGNKMIGNAVNKSGLIAGTALFGGGAWLGRQTAGRLGAWGAENAKYQDAANKERKGVWDSIKGGAARARLYTANTARDATYDARNATVPTSVIADATRGTLGRTRFGRMVGADQFELGNIPAGAPLASTLDAGKAGTKGYKQLQDEKDKKFRDADAKAATEYRATQDKKAITEGAKSGVVEGSPEFIAMEKSITKQSDKQIEALVAGNRQLLDSLNFANSISVRQLEAIMKSDQLTDSEKDRLKNARFKDIDAIEDTAQQTSLLATVAAGKAVGATPLQVADGAKAQKTLDKAKARIKSLTDSEMEMMDSRYLESDDVIKEMRSAQFESIAKSSKFTSSQKKKIKDKRVEPLLNATDTLTSTARPGKTHSPDKALVEKMIRKDLSGKDVAGLYGTEVTFVDHTGVSDKRSILLHPDVIESYSPKLLARMSDELNPSAILEIRNAIENQALSYTAPGSAPLPKQLEATEKWLRSKEGIDKFS